VQRQTFSPLKVDNSLSGGFVQSLIFKSLRFKVFRSIELLFFPQFSVRPDANDPCALQEKQQET
jgi:hypothetical protein